MRHAIAAAFVLLIAGFASPTLRGEPLEAPAATSAEAASANDHSVGPGLAPRVELEAAHGMIERFPDPAARAAHDRMLDGPPVAPNYCS